MARIDALRLVAGGGEVGDEFELLHGWVILAASGMLRPIRVRGVADRRYACPGEGLAGLAHEEDARGAATEVRCSA